jgi:hypothetical protein
MQEITFTPDGKFLIADFTYQHFPLFQKLLKTKNQKQDTDYEFTHEKND